MCGIFAVFNDEDHGKYEPNFNNGKNRGPDNSTFLTVCNKILLGFHRLSINGLDEISNQPLYHKNIILICNGEIYNHQELTEHLDTEMTSSSDCEIIIHLYQKYGIEQALQMLDGVFAFILIDTTHKKCYICRDPYGVRPLMTYKKDHLIILGSELKFFDSHIVPQYDELKQFAPGHFMELHFDERSRLFFEQKYLPYTRFPFSYSRDTIKNSKLDEKIFSNIRHYFQQAVHKRIENTDREVCCLLSGGLDSSLVCAIAQIYTNQPIKTFSIGLPNSVDLKMAKLVANHIGSIHKEIIVSEDDFFDSIPTVIKTIESYDTTTVRASVGNYLVAKYISENTDCKVVLNGDGSDELMGGYLYFSACKDSYEFDKECKRRLQDISHFDVLRSDKSISGNGLEPRTPFLDRTWVQYYLSLSPHIRNHNIDNNMEKFLLRKAFDTTNLLPDTVLWRRKEAFSDGVSGKSKSWSEIIQEKVESLPSDILEKINVTYDFNNAITKEQQYYRYLFELHYKHCEKTIPYFWMPKYVNATDSSARTLSLYQHDDESHRKNKLAN